MKTNKINLIFLIISIVGIISFFLPWFNLTLLGSYSGYDVFSYGDKLGIDKAYYLVIFPISFIVIAILKLELIKIKPIFNKLIELIPISLLALTFFKSLNYFDLEIIKTTLFEIMDFGLILTVISSILIVYSPFSKNYKKQLVITSIILTLLIVISTVLFFQDNRNMKEIHQEQEASIEESTSETLSDDNDLFSDDADFGDVEAAHLALDTTKAEK